MRSDVAATHGPVIEIRNQLPRLEAGIAALQPQLEQHSDIVTTRICESTDTLSQKLDNFHYAMQGFEERIENKLTMAFVAAYERQLGAPGGLVS